MNDAYPVHLIHTGEVVDLYSEYGADKFLKQCSNKNDFKLFSQEFKRADAIRKRGKRKGKLNCADRHNLFDIYGMLQLIVGNCDKLVFEERVPKEEISSWLSHAAAVFQDLSKDQHWIRTGTLLMHDEALLTSCYYLFQHLVPVRLVFADFSFFQSISALILARKGAKYPYLDPHLAWTIKAMLGNTLFCSMLKIDRYRAEKVFKRWEASGILGPYILCVAIKQPSEQAVPSYEHIVLGCLLLCLALIEKAFKVGTPSGDLLRTVLNGHMVVCPKTLPYLQSLLKISNRLEDNAIPVTHTFCQHCDKLTTTNLRCQRCGFVCYCTKDCQLADWKQHKPICNRELKHFFKNSDLMTRLVFDFAERHFIDIMVKLVEESESVGGLTIKDVVVDLDFTPDTNGNIPMLQETPQFNIHSKTKYIDAQAKIGFPRGDDRESFAARLYSNACEHATLLCFTNFPGGSKCCNILRTQDPYTGKNLYTEENLCAFRRAVLFDDYCLLANMFPEQDRWKHAAEKISLLRAMKGRSSDNSDAK